MAVIGEVAPLARLSVEEGLHAAEMALGQQLREAGLLVAPDEHQEGGEQQDAADGAEHMAVKARGKGEDHGEEGDGAKQHEALQALLLPPDGLQVALLPFVEINHRITSGMS